MAGEKDRYAFRIAFGTFLTVLLGTVMASIHLSTLGLTFGSVLYGSPNLIRGRPASFRVAAIDAQRHQEILGAEVRLTLRDTQGTRWEAQRKVERAAHVDFTVQVPTDIDTMAELEVSLQTNQGDDVFQHSLPVLARSEKTHLTLSHPNEFLIQGPKPAPSTGITLYPQLGKVLSGLTTHIYGRLTKNGIGGSFPLRFGPYETELMVSPAGVFQFDHVPLPPTKGIDFWVGTSPAIKIVVPVEKISVPFQLRPQEDPWGAAGSTIRFEVEKLPFDEPLLIDLYEGSTITFSTTQELPGRTGELEVPIPEAARGWVRVSAQRHLSVAADRVLHRWMWISDVPESDLREELVTALRSLPGEASFLQDPIMDAYLEFSQDQRALLAMAISRLDGATLGLPMLRSTLEQRRIRINTQLATQRWQLNLLFVITAVFGLILLSVWVARHHLQVRTNLEQVIDEAREAGEDVDAEDASRLTNLAHGFELGLVVVALGLATWGIWVLLSRMQWSW